MLVMTSEPQYGTLFIDEELHHPISRLLSGMRVIMANEPPLYREVIAAAVRALRPAVEIFCVEPDALGREMSRARPGLVISSEPNDCDTDLCSAWIVLYPEGEATYCLDGRNEKITLHHVTLEDILALIDLAAKTGRRSYYSK